MTAASSRENWLVVGLRNGGEKIVREVPEPLALAAAREIASGEVNALAVLSPSTRAVFGETELGADIGLTVFLPWQRPPVLGLKFDRHDVQSFCCSVAAIRVLLGRMGDSEGGIGVLCFKLLAEIAQGGLVVGCLVVRQVGRLGGGIESASNGKSAAQQDSAMPATIVMAHRGLARHLRAALSRIAAIRGPHRRVLVGLDIDALELDSCERVAADFPLVEFFRVRPTPAGPYVVRKNLIDRATDPFIVFHDSDDLSCSDRIEKLMPSFVDPDVGLVGSHELRLDELARRVIAVRYPQDVNGALSVGPAPVQLHPSTIIRREVYQRVGGFSTHVVFSGDTQLLLRAFFHTTVRNVDEFLYVRRKHADALTVRPDTGNGTPARMRTEAPWWSDFARVKAGHRKIEESSLRRFESQIAYAFERMSRHPDEREVRGLTAHDQC